METIGPGLLLAEDYLRWPGFRLPSVLEWEHAARCGAVTNRFFGDAVQDLDAYCWWVETSQERLWPVGRKRPNFFGLFDVHGNVSEWCHEADVAFDSSQQPTRGGDYRSTQRFLSPAFPTNAASTSLLSTNGFRIVRIKADK